MNNILSVLSSFPKVHVIEAYTGRHVCYYEGSDLAKHLSVDRFAEVRFYQNEMPAVFYETDNALRHIAQSNSTGFEKWLKKHTH